MSESEPTTRDRVVELLNTAAFLPSEKERIGQLVQVQELIIHREPDLLDSFFEEVAAFQTDRNSDVRKFVVGFIEEACKKDVAMLPRLVPNIQLLLQDEGVAVVKRVVQAAAQLHRATLAWLSSARTVTPEMEQVWHIITSIKNSIITMIDHDNDGVRTQAIKFLESLVLLQTYTEADSVVRDGEFNLDQVPLTLKVARPRKLEEEARMVLNKLIAFQGSIHISSVNLMTCMSSLTIIARARPQFLGMIINALEILHANLPPTLTKSQVNSVRKHLKIQMLNLLKHPASYDYHEHITTVLNDLGITASEVNKSMPSKDQIRKRVRRDKSAEEVSESPNKKPRVDHEESSKNKKEKKEEVEVERKNSAIDITQRWLVEKLTPDNVASLVMVTMLNLPDEMPPLFSAGYSPITAAGTSPQIQHVGRLIASQLTAAGVGPGVEQAKEEEAKTSSNMDQESDEESKEISRLVGGKVQVQEEDTMQSGPVLVPAGVIGRPLRHKIKTMKLAEVTKPLSSSSNTKLQSLLFKRLMRCDKVMLHGEGPKHRMRILTVLSGCISHQESDALEDFILEDMQNRADLLFSWLFSEYSVNHDFSLINKILNIGGKKVQKKDKNYQEILGNIVSKVLLKPASKERDEFLSRLFLECPHVPEDLILSLVRVGSQGTDSIISVANTLKDTAEWRPLTAKPALKTLSLLATHDQDSVREVVTPILLDLCEHENLSEIVTEVATVYLKYLLLETPPDSLCSHNFGRPNEPNEWTEPLVKACLYLYLALLPLNQALIHDLAQVYVKTVNEAKRAILRLLEGPIRHMGMDSPQLLKLVETCPKGGETLITRIIHILTEKAPPSEALVCRVRELYNRRVSDVRFLIPVLTGLSKKEVIAVLPKLIKLNPHVVKEVFNRLWGVTLDTGASPLTPVDLLVALHLIDPDKCDVKTVIKATGLCFAERGIYTAEVLAFVLQQLMEQPQLPTLFMRTVIQTLTHYPKLLSFIMNILQRLIIKQVWKQRKVWEGFIKCCQRAVPQSFTVLLQLPPAQLSDVFNSASDLHSQLLSHIATLTENQRAHIPASLLEVIEGHNPSSQGSRPVDLPPSAQEM
ncbi:symplekin isoform X2 [Penaeus vannamei]|uniref:Putative Symplekin n=1 Tax=Penaeus vannamei TaxID=6689 RepID=A0A423T1M3_PENVA|nr:symplekin-like isoform X2 [Penaeus vannamei]ROT70452.1 putative Symplekin [Penaeus vannamei]